jgi:hypothetical protein
VTCEIDGRPDSVIELERASITDPYVVDVFNRYRTMCRPWVAAVRSSHMWTSPVSQRIQSQSTALVVRVTANTRERSRAASHSPESAGTLSSVNVWVIGSLSSRPIQLQDQPAETN